MEAHRRRWWCGVIVATLGTWPVRAEIISFTASATATIRELGGVSVAEDTKSAAFPDTGVSLPLQVVARLTADEPGAAGAVAAQFADPLTAGGANPEEFAISVTLNSLLADVYYTGTASSAEVRTIRLRPGDVGPAPAGTRVTVAGRLYLDGALAVFAVPEVDDLTGAEVVLRVTVKQEADGAEPKKVLEGELRLTGRSEPPLSVATAGDFPTRGVFDVNLAALDPELGLFRVLVFPQLRMDYTYEAVVDEPLTLRATVEVEATNAPGGVGVAALLGTPFETLPEVIAKTRNEAAAKRMATAIAGERAAPSGEPLAAAGRLAQPVFPLCGALGVETVLGLCGIAALRGGRRAVIK
ncbi:MAG: hypothetical protein AB1601_15990 [Planctomycetota bacterium]